LRGQNPDGSWSTNPGAPGDLNSEHPGIFRLEAGWHPEDRTIYAAGAEFILSKGGISRANVFTKIWLALFGQYGWGGVPSIPPEIIFLPNWFYFNNLRVRQLVTRDHHGPVPGPRRQAGLPAARICPALRALCRTTGQRDYRLGRADRLFSWKSFFRMLDGLFKAWEKLPFHPLRKRALQKVETWVVEHQETDGSWGGIMWPWIYCLMALKSMGYSLDHPVIARGLAGLESFIVEDEDTMLWSRQYHLSGTPPGP